tara:strand:- start:690 stop:914 length:225 start_codon:yes stop_codon:yes gene_type:complete
MSKTDNLMNKSIIKCPKLDLFLKYILKDDIKCPKLEIIYYLMDLLVEKSIIMDILGVLSIIKCPKCTFRTFYNG